jgi:hypothetical protein
MRLKRSSHCYRYAKLGGLPAFLVKALARGAKSRALSEDGLEHDAELSLSLDTLDKIQRYAKPAHN